MLFSFNIKIKEKKIKHLLITGNEDGQLKESVILRD